MRSTIGFICCVLIGIIKVGDCFNIEVDENSTNTFVRSRTINGFDESSSTFQKTSFFGYKLYVQLINDGRENVIEFVAGAPIELMQTYKTSDKEEGGIIKEPNPQARAASSATEAMGAVYYCTTTQNQLKNMTHFKTHNCTMKAGVDRDLSGFELSEHDALGISLATTPLTEKGYTLPSTNTIVTCAHLRQHDCGTTYKAEGACYISEVAAGRGDSQKVIRWNKRVPCRDSCFERDIDLMFVVDGSFSVGNESFAKVKKWIKDVTEGFEITQQVQVGVVQYSYYYPNRDKQTYMKTEIALGQFTDKKGFDAAVDLIKYHGYSTYTAHAINKTAKEDFAGPTSRYPDARRVMILLTDGFADDAADLPGATSYAVQEGIESFAVGVGKYKLSQLKLIAGDSGQVITVDNFDDLTGVVSELQRGIQIMEGSASPEINNELMQCQAGISTTFDKPLLPAIVDSTGNKEPLSSVLTWNSTRTNTFKSPVQILDPQYGKICNEWNALSHIDRLINWPNEKSWCTVLENGALYLGAVGAYDWSGTVIKYDTADDQSADIPGYDEVQRVLPTRTKESYLGYSVTSGNFDGNSKRFVASGAPRYMLEGAVVIYEARTANTNFVSSATIRAHNANRQLGSYFGGTVLATDVNNDGKPDLFVAAPLFTKDTYDEGRVFVYTTDTLANNHFRWARKTYEPRVLVGQKQAGGRFGTAMASAGDLNKDGYNDIIVGAPFTDGDRGSIFIYHGGSDGINTQVKQRISASEIPGTNLQYFGQSIQGGVDLDANQYPDVAVGAPRSDTVVIFRSRPVAKLTGTVTFSTNAIDILQCFGIPNRQCLTLIACIRVDGEGVEPFVDVVFNVTLDTALNDKRIEFRTNENSTQTGYFVKTVNNTRILKGDTTCSTYNIYVKQNILNYFAPILASMTYNLAPSHLQTPLSSINDPFLSNEATAMTLFKTNCGTDGTCDYNLKLASMLTLPAATLNNVTQDLTNNGQRLIVSSETGSRPIVISMNLSNSGEDAFGVRVAITYSYELTPNGLSNILRSNADANSDCVLEYPAESGPNSDQTLRTTVLNYNYNSNLGNILRQHHWCSFEFKLSVASLRGSGSVDNIVIEAIADTRQGGLANDTDASDNVWNVTRPVFYRSDVKDSKDLPIEVPFNFTEGEETATSVTQIGVNTSSINLVYQVDGLGYANIPFSTLSLTYPDALITNATGPYHLLYLYEVSCNPLSLASNTKCICDSSAINMYQLTIAEPNVNNTDGPSVNVTANPNPLQENLFDCSATGNAPLGVCRTLFCNVTNLGNQDSIRISAKFRLWSQSLRVENNTSTILRSEFKYSTEPSTQLINQNGGSVTTLSYIAEVTAKVYTAPVRVVGVNNIWIYILAAIGGLLLLIIIIVIMYKLGFFKSKYADMKQEALEWNDANGANGDVDNASTTDMVGG